LEQHAASQKELPKRASRIGRTETKKKKTIEVNSRTQTCKGLPPWNRCKKGLVNYITIKNEPIEM
jgi:hypothetical protein